MLIYLFQSNTSCLRQAQRSQILRNNSSYSPLHPILYLQASGVQINSPEAVFSTKEKNVLLHLFHNGHILAKNYKNLLNDILLKVLRLIYSSLLSIVI